MLTRRQALRALLGTAAAPLIAQPSLELIERLFWQRSSFPAPYVRAYPDLLDPRFGQYVLGYTVRHEFFDV